MALPVPAQCLLGDLCLSSPSFPSSYLVQGVGGGGVRGQGCILQPLVAAVGLDGRLGGQEHPGEGARCHWTVPGESGGPPCRQ